ncbi:MAG: radical SAM protein [Planctomycetota bacterium]
MSILEQIQGHVMRDLVPGAFPESLGVEMTNRCNLDCVFCPRDDIERPLQNMKDELFQKIADEASHHEFVSFQPQGLGESMAHTRWSALIGYASDKGVWPMTLISNGGLLNDEKIEALLSSKVEVITFSIDSTDPEVFAKVRRRGKLPAIEEKVRQLLEEKKRRKLDKPRIVLRIIRMKENEHEIGEFYQRWTPYLGEGDEITTSEVHTWQGRVEDRTVESFVPVAGQEDPRVPCCMPFKQLNVLVDGDATPCCYDNNAKLLVGNVREKSIEEIWHDEPIEKLRRLHLEGKVDQIPFCAGCKEKVVPTPQQLASLPPEYQAILAENPLLGKQGDGESSQES